MDRDRFEALVDRSAEHDIWTGAVNPQRGTGRLKVAGRQITAHRHAWELAHGPLPAAARVLACPDEPACVRLGHLRVEGSPEPARPTARARKGAGSISQVRPGVWKLAVTAPADVDGKVRRVHRMVHVRNAREAADELASFVAEVRESGGPSSEAASLRFDEAVERFLTEHLRDEKGREDNTIRGYRAVHHKWFAPHIGSRLVRDIDEATLDRLFGRMRVAGLSRSSLNQAKSLYMPFFRWARKRGLTRRNPMADFRLPTSTYVSPERIPPEVEELTALLAAAVEVVPDVAPVLALGAVTGMRRGELVGLRRSRVRWRELRLTVNAAVDGSRVKGTKTPKERTFYVDEATIAMLQRVCDQQDDLAAAAGAEVAPDPFLFTLSLDGSKPMPTDYLTRRVARLKLHLGIDQKRPATVALEHEALRLFHEEPSPRPAGRRGPTPKGGLSFGEIGARLGRSERWAAMAVAAAEEREAATTRGRKFDFDGSILALRRFTSSELLDAGFNISMVAQRQGHGPQVLTKHYAKSRRSADRRAAEHLGRVVHGESTS
jgi:integrase